MKMRGWPTDRTARATSSRIARIQTLTPDFINDDFLWNCCFEIGGGNVDEVLYGNRDKYFGFNLTNKQTGQSPLVNEQNETLEFNYLQNLNSNGYPRLYI